MRPDASLRIGFADEFPRSAFTAAPIGFVMIIARAASAEMSLMRSPLVCVPENATAGTLIGSWMTGPLSEACLSRCSWPLAPESNRPAAKRFLMSQGVILLSPIHRKKIGYSVFQSNIILRWYVDCLFRLRCVVLGMLPLQRRGVTSIASCDFPFFYR